MAIKDDVRYLATWCLRPGGEALRWYKISTGGFPVVEASERVLASLDGKELARYEGDLRRVAEASRAAYLPFKSNDGGGRYACGDLENCGKVWPLTGEPEHSEECRYGSALRVLASLEPADAPV